MFDSRNKFGTDDEGKMEPSLAQIALLDFIVKAGGKGKVRKRPTDIRSFLQFQTSLCPAYESQVAQFFLSRDPATQS